MHSLRVGTTEKNLTDLCLLHTFTTIYLFLFSILMLLGKKTVKQNKKSEVGERKRKIASNSEHKTNQRMLKRYTYIVVLSFKHMVEIHSTLTTPTQLSS